MTLETIDDVIYESSETFTLSGTITSDNTTSTSVESTITIEDNEDVPTVSINDISIEEGEEGVLTISLSGESSTDTEFEIITVDDSATGGSDYTQIDTTTLTITAGYTSVAVNVSALTDDLVESDEDFFLEITATSSNTSNDSVTGTVTITDLNSADCYPVGNETTDTDGDGLTDCEEVIGAGFDDPSTTGVAIETTDPDDPCDVLPEEVGNEPDTTNDIWSAADCDGDGVTNGQETIDFTDPYDDCDFETDSITETVTSTEDCDGDGVTNEDEYADETDPNDACDYEEVSITEIVISSEDCDGDGVTNDFEYTDGTDPLDACDYEEASITEDVTSSEDCDGDGVTNENENTDGTDPFDECDFELTSITLEITRERNCIDSSDPLKVFNTITPNGDNVNDYMVIENIESTSSNQINIFNRWGVQVFETDDYESNPFSGSSSGRATVLPSEILPSGTYYYVLKYVLDGERGTQVGYLYIN